MRYEYRGHDIVVTSMRGPVAVYRSGDAVLRFTARSVNEAQQIIDQERHNGYLA